MSATDPTLVRSSVRQTVDLFVWVYMILSHSPIHVRFSCVFFTRDWLGLEPQRQSACQQGAGKRLVFNLLRPDSIAWNCDREARSFSPDSLWIFGSRIFVPFFFLPLPLSSAFFFLHLPLYHVFPLPLLSSFLYLLFPSLVLRFFMNLFFIFERSRPTFTWGISVDWNCFRLCAFISSVFILAPRDQVGASFAEQALYYSSLVHLKGLISRECRFCADYIVSAGLPPTSRLFTRIFAPQGFNVSSRFFLTRLEKIRVWINWWINPRLFKR